MNKFTGDADLIRQLGGPAKLANLLGYQENGGAQRVQNWITRGVPSLVKINFPHLFLVGKGFPAVNLAETQPGQAKPAKAASR